VSFIARQAVPGRTVDLGVEGDPLHRGARAIFMSGSVAAV
jgi:hypothetical protein